MYWQLAATAVMLGVPVLAQLENNNLPKVILLIS
jgi:hypothetical protein